MYIGGIVRGGLGAAPRGAGVFLRARTTQGEGSDRPVSPSPLPLLCISPSRRTPPPRFPRHRPFPSAAFSAIRHRGRRPRAGCKLIPKRLFKVEGLRPRAGPEAGQGAGERSPAAESLRSHCGAARRQRSAFPRPRGLLLAAWQHGEGGETGLFGPLRSG